MWYPIKVSKSLFPVIKQILFDIIFNKIIRLTFPLCKSQCFRICLFIQLKWNSLYQIILTIYRVQWFYNFFLVTKLLIIISKVWKIRCRAVLKNKVSENNKNINIKNLRIDNKHRINIYINLTEFNTFEVLSLSCKTMNLISNFSVYYCTVPLLTFKSKLVFS